MFQFYYKSLFHSTEGIYETVSLAVETGCGSDGGCDGNG